MCFLFVFAALLEYAAVNYSFYGCRSENNETVSEWPESKTQRSGNDEEETEGSLQLRDFVPPSLIEVIHLHHSWRYAEWKPRVPCDFRWYLYAYQSNESHIAFAIMNTSLLMRSDAGKSCYAASSSFSLRSDLSDADTTQWLSDLKILFSSGSEIRIGRHVFPQEVLLEPVDNQILLS